MNQIKNIILPDGEMTHTEQLVFNLNLQISRKIKETREEMHLTQEELSQLSGVNRSTISLIEKRQRTASIETLLKLLDALNLTIAIIQV